MGSVHTIFVIDIFSFLLSFRMLCCLMCSSDTLKAGLM
jgi:hypothetical protein